MNTRKTAQNHKLRTQELLTLILLFGVTDYIIAAESDESTVVTDNKSTKIKKAEATDDSIMTLGTVTVKDRNPSNKSKKLSSKDITTSVDVMYADKIADQNVLTAYDLFHRMPGIQVTQFGQGTTTGKISFRGFNGEGRTNAVKLLIDGIPSNTNSGDMYYIDGLFPQDIESMEVVRGTNDPRYGLHNIAGNVNINTSTGGNYIKGRASYGSFNTHDIQSGLGYEKDGFSQNYQISYRSSDGFRDHSNSNKDSFSGKWFFTPDDNKYKVGLITRWSDADAQEPGYLTVSEQAQSLTQSKQRNLTDGGQRTVAQVSAHFDLNISDELFWSNKAYGNLFKDQRYVTFTPTDAQREREKREGQSGAITSLTYHPKVQVIEDFSLETGFDFQHQDNEYIQYVTTNRVRGALKNNEKWSFLNYGGYIQAVIKPFKWLKITPGYRADAIDGDYFNYRLGSTYGSFPVNNYGIISQPKIGVVVTPIEGYSFYGNWGRTFQVGVGQATFIGPNQHNIGPSLNDGWELGVKVKPVDWAEGRVAYWMQTASNEISRSLTSTDATFIGPTRRQGIDIEAKIYPTDRMGVWGNFSLQSARTINPPAFAAASMEYYQMNDVVNTPPYLFSAGLDYQFTKNFRSSLWASGQGSYHVNQSNNLGKYGQYALLNLDLAYKLTKQVELQFQAKNLGDAHRTYVWYDETYGNQAQVMYSPGDSRAFYGAVDVKFDI